MKRLTVAWLSAFLFIGSALTSYAQTNSPIPERDSSSVSLFEYAPAVIGGISAVVFLLAFGASRFMLPSLMVTTAFLLIFTPGKRKMEEAVSGKTISTKPVSGKAAIGKTISGKSV